MWLLPVGVTAGQRLAGLPMPDSADLSGLTQDWGTG